MDYNRLMKFKSALLNTQEARNYSTVLLSAFSRRSDFMSAQELAELYCTKPEARPFIFDMVSLASFPDFREEFEKELQGRLSQFSASPLETSAQSSPSHTDPHSYLHALEVAETREKVASAQSSPLVTEQPNQSNDDPCTNCSERLTGVAGESCKNCIYK